MTSKISIIMKLKLLFSLIVVISSFNGLSAQISYPGNNPGQAMIKTVPGNQVVFENNAIKIVFANG